MRYILIVFAPLNPGTADERYNVYGCLNAGANEKIATCANRLEAMQKAHEFKVPVMEGDTFRHILEKLQK